MIKSLVIEAFSNSFNHFLDLVRYKTPSQKILTRCGGISLKNFQCGEINRMYLLLGEKGPNNPLYGEKNHKNLRCGEIEQKKILIGQKD